MARASSLMGVGFAPVAALAMNGFGTTQNVTAVGTALATGAALSGDLNIVTTAGGQTAVVLPSASIGESVFVYVPTATSALVFPESVSVQINEVAGGSSLTVAQGRIAQFFRVSATKWLSLYSA